MRLHSILSQFFIRHKAHEIEKSVVLPPYQIKGIFLQSKRRDPNFEKIIKIKLKINSCQVRYGRT